MKLVFFKVKQTNRNLQKNVHFSSLNQLIYAHVQRREPKRSAKGSNLKEDDRALLLQELLLYGYSSVGTDMYLLVDEGLPEQDKAIGGQQAKPGQQGTYSWMKGSQNRRPNLATRVNTTVSPNQYRVNIGKDLNKIV